VNLRLRQLKIFEVLARHLSFTCASKELYLTQPAVSMRIEEAAGLALFEQVGKRIYLTEAGLGLGLQTLEMELALAHKRLVILDVRDLPILRAWYIMHRCGKRLSAVTQTFKHFVIKESARILDLPTLH